MRTGIVALRSFRERVREVLVHFDELLFDSKKSFHKHRIEMISFALKDNGARGQVGKSTFVYALGNQGIVNIRHRDDPPRKRDLISC